LFNLAGNAAPMPTRLLLPNGDLASPIALARNKTTTETDLYAIDGSTLYRRGADEQVDDNSVGKSIMVNSAFSGTNTLVALTHNDLTTIFGENAKTTVYYTSCPLDKLERAESWTVPVPALNGVECITSYISAKYDGNRFSLQVRGNLSAHPSLQHDRIRPESV